MVQAPGAKAIGQDNGAIPVRREDGEAPAIAAALRLLADGGVIRKAREEAGGRGRQARVDGGAVAAGAGEAVAVGADGGNQYFDRKDFARWKIASCCVGRPQCFTS